MKMNMKELGMENKGADRLMTERQNVHCLPRPFYTFGLLDRTANVKRKNQEVPNRSAPLIDWALYYHQLGWSIIPIGFGKKPPKGFKWKKYQKTRPTKAELRQWFGNGRYKSLAVVCGVVSGRLAVLDIDSEQCCQWWRRERPKSTETLPMVKTKKGQHFYFRSEPFQKRNGDDVDLLCEGAYAMLPPSPNKTWIIPLNGELPMLNPFEWGLEQFGIRKPETKLRVTEDTEETEDPKDTDDKERHRSHKKVCERIC
jgi:hypothetical protein